MVRARDDLVANNQLEACRDAFWPGVKILFADTASKIALAFLRRYPTPGSARGLGVECMAAFLTKHGYLGHWSAPELLELLHAAPEGIAECPEAETCHDVGLGHVRVIGALDISIKSLDPSVVHHPGEQ